MRVLITYGSKNGSTAGLATMIGDALELRDIQAEVRPARAVGPVDSYDTVVVAGALYAGRWHRDARRFVARNERAFREMPVWLVSSGPLDDTAKTGELPPVGQVAKLARRIHARGVMTFGGRLTTDAAGFMARAMAKTKAGDWRDIDQVAELSVRIATDLGQIEAMKG